MAGGIPSFPGVFMVLLFLDGLGIPSFHGVAVDGGFLVFMVLLLHSKEAALVGTLTLPNSDPCILFLLYIPFL